MLGDELVEEPPALGLAAALSVLGAGGVVTVGAGLAAAGAVGAGAGGAGVLLVVVCVTVTGADWRVKPFTTVFLGCLSA